MIPFTSISEGEFEEDEDDPFTSISKGEFEEDEDDSLHQHQ